MVAKVQNKQGQAEAEKQLQLLKGLTAALDEAVTITKTEENGGWEIVYVNEAFTRLTGYMPDEVVGRSPKFLQGAETDPRVLRSLSNRLAEAQPFHGRTVNYRKSGEPFAMDWEVVTFHDETGNKRFYMAVQREVV